MADLNAATIDDVRNFFKTYHVPNNATMVIAGDFDTASTIEILGEEPFRKLFRRARYRSLRYGEGTSARRKSAGSAVGSDSADCPRTLPAITFPHIRPSLLSIH